MKSKESNEIRIFQNRNFSLLFWGILVSNVAHILFSFTISFFILAVASDAYGQGNATLIQSAYLALNGIILLVLTPLGGVLADKWNKAKIMYVTDFIRGITILLTGTFIILNPSLIGDLVALFIMNVVLSVNAGIFGPASFSLLRFIVNDEEMQKASSYLQGSGSFQSIIGMVLCGLLYGNIGIFWIFLINGIAYIISAISEIFIKYDHRPSEEKISLKNVVADVKDGLVYLYNEKAILAILIMALFVNFFFSPIFAVGLPNFIKFGLGTETAYLFDGFLSPTAWMSTIQIGLSIAAIVMSIIISARVAKENQGHSLKMALVGMVIPVVVIAVTLIGYYGNWLSINLVLIILALSMIGLGIANVSFNVPITVIMQKKVERKMLGKVASVTNVLSMGLIPLSSILAGVVIAKVSSSALYAVCAVGITLVAFFYVRSKAAELI